MGISKRLPYIRPSKGHPEHRHHRKQLEKENPAFGWIQYAVLGLLGVTLLLNVEKDVSRCEEKHQREDKEREERNKSRQRTRSEGRDDRRLQRRDASRSSTGSWERRSRGGEMYDDYYHDDDRDRYYGRGGGSEYGHDGYDGRSSDAGHGRSDRYYGEPPRRSRSRY